MKTTAPLFQNKVFALFFVLLALIFMASQVEIGTWGLNKTVGWAWDLMPINLFLLVGNAVVFVLMVALSLGLSFRMNKSVSMLQAILIIAACTSLMSWNAFLILGMNGFLIVLFFVNLIWTIKRRQIDRSNPD